MIGSSNVFMTLVSARFVLFDNNIVLPLDGHDSTNEGLDVVRAQVGFKVGQGLPGLNERVFAKVIHVLEEELRKF